MSRDLPARPNLEHLKNQAKNLLHDFRKGDRKAVERLRSLASISSPDQPKLSDTQHAIAREYGFASWAKLKEHVESLAQPSDPTEALKAAVIASDARRVAKVLEHHPEPCEFLAKLTGKHLVLKVPTATGPAARAARLAARVGRTAALTCSALITPYSVGTWRTWMPPRATPAE